MITQKCQIIVIVFSRLFCDYFIKSVNIVRSINLIEIVSILYVMFVKLMLILKFKFQRNYFEGVPSIFSLPVKPVLLLEIFIRLPLEN